MCKIFTLTNMSQIKNVRELTDVVAASLAALEADGFGYSIQGAKGAYGERTLFPSLFRSDFSQKLLSVPFAYETYNRFGTKSKAIGPGIFHGRTSTNQRTLVNTHPINKNGWTLIHNGVVSNNGPEYHRETTNDTEHLAHYLSTEGIKAVERYLSGYYAVTAIDKTGKLHVFKDAIAKLYVSEIVEIKSFVFATTQQLIIDVCEEMGWTHSTINIVNDNSYMVFQNNTLLSHETIKPLGKTAYESQYAKLSLGYDLADDIRDISSRSAEVFGDMDLTESERKFLEECTQCADASYFFKDYHGYPISLEQFKALSNEEKLYCEVVRGDGTIVDQADYDSERLYQGAV